MVVFGETDWAFSIFDTVGAVDHFTNLPVGKMTCSTT